MCIFQLQTWTMSLHESDMIGPYQSLSMVNSQVLRVLNDNPFVNCFIDVITISYCSISFLKMSRQNGRVSDRYRTSHGMVHTITE